jgi:hypothetical protein
MMAGGEPVTGQTFSPRVAAEEKQGLARRLNGCRASWKRGKGAGQFPRDITRDGFAFRMKPRDQAVGRISAAANAVTVPASAC